jgi:hypothetical protein
VLATKSKKKKTKITLPLTTCALMEHLPRVLASLAVQHVLAKKRWWKDVARAGEFETCLTVPHYEFHACVKGACRGGHLQMVRAMKIDFHGALLEESLHLACRAGSRALAGFLMLKGCKNHTWALEGACRGGHRELALAFLAKGAISDFGMYSACRGGHLGLALLMVRSGATRWEGGLTGAARGGHVELAKLMLEKGAANSADALIEACQRGQLEMVRFLCDKGAEPLNAAFEQARACGHAHIVRFLVDRGATA